MVKFIDDIDNNVDIEMLEMEEKRNFVAENNKTEKEANAFIGNIKKYFSDINWEKYNDSSIQDALAHALRALAIDNLRHGTGAVASGFRGEYFPEAFQCAPTWQDFCKKQEKDREWGTYIELKSLAATFGFSVVVTTNSAEFVLHRAEDPKAPIMQVTNTDNTHWDFKGTGQTKGNGNCLYNSVAQFLLDQVLNVINPLLKNGDVNGQKSPSSKPSNTKSTPQKINNFSANKPIVNKPVAIQPQPTKKIVPTLTTKSIVPSSRVQLQNKPTIPANNTLNDVTNTTNTSIITSSVDTLFNISKSQLEEEQRLQRLVAKAPKPSDVQHNLENEKKRIANLSQKEQQQIFNDYKLALKLSKEEEKRRITSFCR